MSTVAVIATTVIFVILAFEMVVMARDYGKVINISTMQNAFDRLNKLPLDDEDVLHPTTNSFPITIITEVLNGKENYTCPNVIANFETILNRTTFASVNLTCYEEYQLRLIMSQDLRILKDLQK